MSYLDIDDQLFELQKACNRHIDPLANWVLYAVNRYISTDRATRLFLDNFCKADCKKFPEIISKCLEGDRCDDAIIRKFKRLI